MSATIENPQREEWMARLNAANAIRLRCAAEKREIASMTRPDAMRRVADHLEHPEPYLYRLKAYSLVIAISRFGPRRTRELLACAYASENRRIAELTDRQRTMLAGWLRDQATCEEMA